MKRLIFLFILIGLISCSSKEEQKTIKLSKYESPELGWIFEFPENWKVLSNNEISKIENKGQDLIEKTIGEDVPLTRKNLLWLKKDDFNTFTSVMEPYDAKKDGPYSEITSSLKQVLIDTYKNQGIVFDFKEGKEKIGGKEFSYVEFDLYSIKSGKKEKLMNQIVYDGLITENLSLTMSVNFNNDANKDEIMKIIKTSKFSK